MLRKRDEIVFFMIFLVIMIPFCSADAIAASQIHSVSIMGQDGIEGVLRQQDMKFVEALARFDDDSEVLPSNLLLGSVPFTSCSLDPTTMFYTCQWASGSLENTETGRVSSLSVSMVDQSGNTVATRSGSYVADNTKPSITALSVSPSLASSEDEVTVRYTVNDYAATSLGTRYCSGIVSVDVYVDDTLIMNVPTDSPECTFSSEFTAPASGFGVTEGEVELCVVAKDLFGYESKERCDTFTVDVTGPELSAFTVYDSRYNPAYFVPAGDTIKLNFELNITETGTGLSTTDTKIDFSNISGGQVSQISPSSCTAQDDVQVCTWRDVAVKMSADTPTAVSITVADNAGNTAEYSLETGLIIDDERPELISIRSNLTVEDKVFFNSQENLIVVEVIESGSGFYSKNLILDLSALTGDSHVEPDYCIEGWACFYENIVPKTGLSGEVAVNVLPESSDDAGNSIAGILSTLVYVDTSEPVIKSMEGTSQSGLSEKNLLEGDMIDITVVVEEDISSVYAEADLSELVGQEDLVVAATCYPASEYEEMIGAVEMSYEEDTGVQVEEYEEESVEDGTGEDITGDMVMVRAEEDEESDPLTSKDITFGYKRTEEVAEQYAYGEWVCVFSQVGPAQVAPESGKIPIKVYDSAGNFAEDELSFEILTAVESDEEDYWEIEADDVQPEYLDLETIGLIGQTAVATFTITQVGSGELASQQLVECTEEGDGGLIDYVEEIYDAEGTKIVQFFFNPLPLDANSGDLYPITCTFSTATKVGTQLVRETDDVEVEFTLLNNPLGEMSEKLDKEIEDILNSVKDSAKAIDVMLDVFAAVNNICMMITMVQTITLLLGGIADVLKYITLTKPVGDELGGVVALINDLMTSITKVTQWICGVASCTLDKKIPGYGPFMNNYMSMAFGSFNIPVMDVKREKDPTTGEYTAVTKGFNIGSWNAGGGTEGGTKTSAQRAAKGAGAVTGRSVGSGSSTPKTTASTPADDARKDIKGATSGSSSKAGNAAAKKLAQVNAVNEEADKGGNWLDMGFGFSVNKRNDLLTSILYLCLPGILENVQKMQAIDCDYVTCLKTNVPNGMPPELCKQERDMKECKFVWSMFPFLRGLDGVLGAIKTMLTSWEGLVYLIVGVGVCTGLCSAGYGCEVCVIMQWYKSLGALVSYIKNFKQSWKLNNHPCIGVLEAYGPEYDIEGWSDTESFSEDESETPEMDGDLT